MRRGKKKLGLVWRKLFGIEKRTWRSTFIDCILTYSRLYPLPLFFFPLAFSVFPLFFSREQQRCGSISFPSVFCFTSTFLRISAFLPQQTSTLPCCLQWMQKTKQLYCIAFAYDLPIFCFPGIVFFFSFFSLFTSFLRLFVDICHRLWMHVRAQSDIFIYYSSEIEKKNL